MAKAAGKALASFVGLSYGQDGIDHDGYSYSHDHTRGSARIEKGSEIDQLEMALRDGKKELAALEYHSGRLDQTNKRVEAEIQTIKLQIAGAKQDVATVEQDLAATRAHAPVEGVMGERELVGEFRKFTDSIERLVDELHSWYSRYTDNPLTEEQVRVITDNFEGEIGKQDADKFVALTVHINQDGRSIVRALLRFYISLYLVEYVFEPLVPGQLNEGTAILLELQSLVQSKEPQEHSGRWRALTYKTALEPRHDTWCADPATVFVQRFAHILKVIDNIDLVEKDLHDAIELTMKVFNIAAQFRDTVTLMCTEAEFRVYLPRTGDVINASIMDETYNSTWTTSKKVVLGVRLGLELFRNSRDNSHSFRESYCPVHACVIGDKCPLFPASTRSYLPF